MNKLFILTGILLVLTSCAHGILSSNSINSSLSDSSSIESSINSLGSSEIIESSLDTTISSEVSISSSSSSIASIESSSSISSVNTSIKDTSSIISSISKSYVDLSEWKNYLFHDGDYSEMNSDWTYYYNTSKNPENVVRGDKYGVDLNKDKQRLCSPIFNPWEKVEVNIKLRFVPRSSTSYKTVKNKAQLIISCYDENRNKVGSEEIEILKSRIPNDDKVFYTLKIDIYNNKMYSFDIEYGNSVEYSGTKWYTYAINEISLKGWSYSKK